LCFQTNLYTRRASPNEAVTQARLSRTLETAGNLEDAIEKQQEVRRLADPEIQDPIA